MHPGKVQDGVGAVGIYSRQRRMWNRSLRRRLNCSQNASLRDKAISNRNTDQYDTGAVPNSVISSYHPSIPCSLLVARLYSYPPRPRFQQRRYNIFVQSSDSHEFLLAFCYHSICPNTSYAPTPWIVAMLYMMDEEEA